MVAEIERQKVDILLVAMGTPRQEKWVDTFIRPEHARLVITVGALFDFVAGEIPRAPSAIRRLRVEWLYRFLQEPTRLASRYFVGGPVFIGHVLVDMIKSGTAVVLQAATASRQRSDKSTARAGQGERY